MRLKITILICLLCAGLAACARAVPVEDREVLSVSERRTLGYGGVERGYEIRIPEGILQTGVRVPLVLVLHGGGGNGKNAEDMTGFTKKAVLEKFIVVYPEGTGLLERRLRTWNAGHCCGYAMEKNVDDVGFINALLDRLIADYPVDPGRVYVTGMSNGGMLTHRLGAELSFRIAAIAPVVAAIFGDETRPARPVAAMIINGMLDQAVPYLGGMPGGRFPEAWDKKPLKPASDQAAFWALANGCQTDPETEVKARARVTRYRCPAGKEVVSYLLFDVGHAWPGGKAGRRRADNPGDTIHATDVIWEFFKTRTKAQP